MPNSVVARTIAALAVAATMAGAVDAPGLDVPLSNPIAKRLRETGQQKWEQASAVFARQRTVKPDATQPAADELVQALELAEDAIELFEDALELEWDLATNGAQALAAQSWVEMRAQVPPTPLPTDPDELAKWTQQEEREVAKRKRDARRVLSDVLAGRRYTKLFDRCSHCDGRGELSGGYGAKPGERPKKLVCKTCNGDKLTADRKQILASHWFCYSPGFRADGRNRQAINSVLRLGVRGEDKLAPFIMSTQIGGNVEDHGWWVRMTVTEKVHEDPHSSKGVEQDIQYVLMKIGKVWWIHSEQFDKKGLLVLPEPPAPEK